MSVTGSSCYDQNMYFFLIYGFPIFIYMLFTIFPIIIDFYDVLNSLILVLSSHTQMLETLRTCQLKILLFKK